MLKCLISGHRSRSRIRSPLLGTVAGPNSERAREGHRSGGKRNGRRLGRESGDVTHGEVKSEDERTPVGGDGHGSPTPFNGEGAEAGDGASPGEQGQLFGGRRPRGRASAVELECDFVGVGDGVEHAHWTLAPRTGGDIDFEDAAEQLRPADTSRFGARIDEAGGSLPGPARVRPADDPGVRRARCRTATPASGVPLRHSRVLVRASAVCIASGGIVYGALDLA